MNDRTAGAGEPRRAKSTTTSRDPLFGAGLQLSFEQHHETSGGFANLRRLPSLIGITTRLGWHADRPALLLVVLAQLVMAGATAASYFLTRDLLAAMFAPNSRGNITVIAWMAVAMAAVIGVRALFEVVSVGASGRLGPRVARRAQVRLLERAVDAELVAIEDTRFQNLLGAARRGADAAQRLTEGAVTLSSGLLSIITALGVLVLLNPVFVPLLFIALIPRGWSVAKTAGGRYASMKRWMEQTRHRDQLAMLMTHRESAEEVRSNGLGDFLLRHYRRLAVASEGEQARLAREEARVRLLSGALAGGLGLLSYGLLVLLVVTGRMPFAVAGTAAFAIRASTGTFTVLVGQLRQLYEDGLYVRDWDQACAKAAESALSTGRVAPAAQPEVIEAHGLGFVYPNAVKPALKGVDFQVARGEVVALVGENGSGKSTLVKVLSGLYLPSSGSVSWDGVPVRDLDRRQLFDRISVVSQDFVQWPFTARMNVAIGRPGVTDETRLEDAAKTAGATAVVDGLPDGWDALLAREFWGGTNLSGGQWQRIALARAWYRDAPVLIVDEPTAALDPAAEIEVFNRIIELAAHGRAVVLVTHRLASVARADRICVLDGGEIVEEGSHAELIRRQGRYASMYLLQAAQYTASSGVE
jgi:ATP-binding cassette subfamily B protein